MEALIQDVRHGIRSLSSDKSFVLLSILCLGIGIGANTRVFTIVNGLLLQPLPFVDADRPLPAGITSGGRGPRVSLRP